MSKKLSNIQKRHYRVRSKVSGTSERPRFSVYRSNKHIFAQLIDDEKGLTLIGCSTKFAVGKDTKATKGDSSKKLGETIAKKALEKNIKNVVFDRGGYKYHGRIKALADSAREAGLVF